MEDYKNISRIEKLDDGTMNIFMKNGLRAYVEIRKLEAAFKASVYRLREGEIHPGTRLIKELRVNGGLQDCVRDTIGWVDENPMAVDGPEELKEIQKHK